MSTMTLVELKKRSRDQLIAGVVEDIYTTNPIYSYMPFVGFSGPGISVNRETTLGDAAFYAIGSEITHKTPSAVTQILFQPTKIIGDAEVDKLEQAMSASTPSDIVAQEISSKAKNVGRIVQQGIASGTGTTPSMNSVHSMIDSSQYVTGGAFDLALLDALIDKVKSKDGICDWIMMTGREIRRYRAVLRGLGGAAPTIDVQMGNRTIKLNEYNGIPIFQNDYLSVTETATGAALTTGVLSSIYAGVWDDGTKKIGCAMIFPEAIPAGIVVEPIGDMETKDETIWRVKQYTNFAIFNRRGIARLTDMTGL